MTGDRAAGSASTPRGSGPTRSTLAHWVDALLPAVPHPSDGPPYPAATEVAVDRDLAVRIGMLPERERAEFALLLRLVENPWTNLLFGGRPERFSRLDRAGRERYLAAWAGSRMALKRRGFQAVKRLAAGLYFGQPFAGGRHPLWDRVHYAPDPIVTEGPDPFGGHHPIIPDAPTQETADVCVIGSGAGGCVIASRLAAAGHRVVVLEGGPWTPGSAYPRVERTAYERLFLGAGAVTTSDHSIAILAGSSVGGGTTVNWMTCLPPRAEARAEWAGAGGMAGVDGPEFDRLYRTVAERLEVSTRESTINPSNEALRRGCRALGLTEGTDWAIIPRNAVDCRARCGSCTFGCPYGSRRSPATTYLADALAAGGRLYASTRADTVEVEGGRVRGVRATYREDGHAWPVTVRSPVVVVAAGAIETPPLLLRSGIRFPGVGLGLRLDPTVALAGEFPFPVRTWEGPHQTIGVYRFQTLDAGAHGPWIEAAPVHPGLSAVAVPWEGAEEFRRRMERIERIATPIALVRDVGEGRVRCDADGRARIDYVLTRPDRANLVRGQVEIARILAAAGATRLTSLHTPACEVGDGVRPLRPNEVDRFIAEVETRGIRENAVAVFSAHPMGSARAGADPRRSTARPTGEVHGVEGLWIGDGSILPSAPGANPMMSILALAERTSGMLLDRLGGGGAIP